LQQAGASEVQGRVSHPLLHWQMTKERARKLLAKWGKPLLLELLKGIAKGVGLLLLSHFIQ